MFLRNIVKSSQVTARLIGVRLQQNQLPSATCCWTRTYAGDATTTAKEVNVTFVRASGDKIQTKGKVGDTLLDVVVNNNIDLDGFGACEGTLTCSTCHLIFKADDYEKLPDRPGDEELDMLDLAYDLTDTSRLGCQITLTQDMDGLEVNVPATINDARSA